MLNKTIKKNLKEVAELKKNRLVETKIIKSRISFLIESSFKNGGKDLTADQRAELFFKIMNEVSSYNQNQLINEGLGDWLINVLGYKLFSGAGETVVERLVSGVLEKMGMGDSILKNSIVSFIATDPARLKKAFSSCQEFTKLIAESITEAIVMKTSGKDNFFAGSLRNIVGDAIRESDIGSWIENKMSGLVCNLYNKFTTKAKDVAEKVGTSKKQGQSGSVIPAVS